MQVETMIEGGELSNGHPLIAAAPRRHPHIIGEWNANNCIYGGRGHLAASADPRLRLTAAGGPFRLWDVPPWLAEVGLSYHSRPDRWRQGNRLEIVSRGQEFVANIGERDELRRWVEDMIGIIRA